MVLRSGNFVSFFLPESIVLINLLVSVTSESVNIDYYSILSYGQKNVFYWAPLQEFCR